MTLDKQYFAPLRILFSGNDSQFNDFVHVYVEKVLLMKPILKDQKRSQEELEPDILRKSVTVNTNNRASKNELKKQTRFNDNNI
jgi:hypothetical protein